MATKPVKISSFLGVNERLHRSALRVEEGVFVAQAHNVDLTPSGQFVGRAGYQRVVAGSDMYSLWASVAGRGTAAACLAARRHGSDQRGRDGLERQRCGACRVCCDPGGQR